MSINQESNIYMIYTFRTYRGGNHQHCRCFFFLAIVRVSHTDGIARADRGRLRSTRRTGRQALGRAQAEEEAAKVDGAGAEVELVGLTSGEGHGGNISIVHGNKEAALGERTVSRLGSSADVTSTDGGLSTRTSTFQL